MLLEKRVEVLSEALEMKDAQLGEVLAAAHLDPATLQQVGSTTQAASPSYSLHLISTVEPARQHYCSASILARHVCCR